VRVLVLGGLELTTRLSEEFGEGVEIVLIDPDGTLRGVRSGEGRVRFEPDQALVRPRMDGDVMS
jgi:hypothetical protein